MENPYAPPEADLVTAEQAEAARYYIVSKRKVLLFSIASLGIYLIYWNYRHWKQIVSVSTVSAIPFLRGLFSVFFFHSLTNDIADQLEEKQLSHDWNRGALALTYVVSWFLSNFLDRFESLGILGLQNDVIYLIVALGLTGLLCWAVYRVQMAANLAADDPNGKSNDFFSAANIVWLVFFALFWLLALAGIFLEDLPELDSPPATI